MLVGYWAAGDVVITFVTQAGPRATHQRDHYEPDASHDLRLIAQLYRDSGRRWTYLGDWHSHMLKGERLSDLDRTTLRTIADTSSARLARPVMAIVTRGTHPSTAIWVFERRAKRRSCHVRRAQILPFHAVEPASADAWHMTVSQSTYARQEVVCGAASPTRLLRTRVLAARGRLSTAEPGA